MFQHLYLQHVPPKCPPFPFLTANNVDPKLTYTIQDGNITELIRKQISHGVFM